MVGKAADVYQYLEPLYNDYRKIRRRGVTGCARGSLTVSQGHTTYNAYSTQRASARETPNSGAPVMLHAADNCCDSAWERPAEIALSEGGVAGVF